MSEMTDERWVLAARYLSGEMHIDEQYAFEQWCDVDADHRQWFEEVRLVWDRTNAKGVAIDVDAAWRNVKRRMEPRLERGAATRSSRRHQRRFNFFGPVFAIAVVLIVVGSVLWFAGESPEEGTPVAEPRIVAAAQGERVNVLLRDGTAVELAPNSNLTIPNDFGYDYRTVTLDGLAYFDVSYDADHEFIVETSRGSVRVLGTRFVVRDYADTSEPFEVAVDDGSVETRAGSDVLRLEALQFTRLREDGLRSGSIENPAVHFGWRQGHLVFHDTGLAQVSAMLERWYGMEIEIDEALSGRRLTASFTGDAPDDVMDVIALTLNARLEREGDNFRLSAADR